MSRLTASPFHKPSPFEFPKAPFSPPETNVDMIGPARVPMPGYIAGGQEQRVSDMESSPGVLESAGSRFRKVSSIAYHTSGTREFNTRTPQRNPKAFIIVIPPPTFDHEHGQLGHTLSSGPRHRLSQGLLMPLFPTMYGQLTAIAREFNFPSTTGLCLYFHITENGATMTPRISDETWQSIWNHIFEAATPAPAQRSPISGKIEFDIDLSQARWYASWVSPSHRDHLENPFSTNPSAAPSIAHFHRESKSSVEEHLDEQSLTPTRLPVRLNGIAAPTARHIPRKLSLVDRYDAMSIRSGSRRSALSPPEPVQLTSQVLSPIVQEDEPKSARHALDTRVMSWRASAVLKPTPLAATGQISLEPANMPNMLPIDDALISVPNQELDLGDFTWSISSLGPDEDEPISPISWERLPSIHIAHRMEGSVCMTPSDCTSFGPSDYTLPSPAVSFYRLPSPDIAHRMYEDVPPTPSTVTTWGAPFSYPPSPVCYPRTFSPDLGDRCVFSRPTTPLTATSWGPGSWPPSPVNVDRAQSIHMCDRGEFSRPVTPSTATSWGVPLSYPPTPSTPYHVHTPDMGQRVFEKDILNLPWNNKPWGHSWPYSQAISSARQPTQGLHLHVYSDYPHFNIYPSIYPHFDMYPAPAGAMPIRNAASDPQINAPRLPVIIKLPAIYPSFEIYPSVYPRSLEEIYPVINIQSNSTFSASPTLQYPFFDLYPTIHLHEVPRLEFPAVAHSHTYAQNRDATQHSDVSIDPITPKVNTEVDNGLLRDSPFDLCMPSKTSPTSPSGNHNMATAVMSVYPSFNLYPAVYPVYDNYPVGYEIKAVHDGCRPGYPHFDLYPTIHKDPTTSSEVSSPYHMELISVRLSVYPVFDIYPASYPAFNIYPAVDNAPHGETGSPISDLLHRKHVAEWGDRFPRCAQFKPLIKRTELSTQLNTYPVFNLYPALYPFFNLYPVVDYSPMTKERNDFMHRCLQCDLRPLPLPSSDVKATSSQDISNLSINIHTYPVFNLYPALYPHFNLYPTVEYNHVSRQDVKTPKRPIELSIHINAYPIFNLYPALYPTFNIYPAVQDGSLFEHGARNECPHHGLYNLFSKHQLETQESNRRPVSVRISPSYPNFNLYPPVYPFFDIYPHLSKENTNPLSSYSKYPNFIVYPDVTKHIGMQSQIRGSTKAVHYPTFELYPPIYPCRDLSPSRFLKYAEEERAVNIRFDYQYPAFSLYPAVYPYFELWPPVNQPRIAPFPKANSRLTHSELHAMVMMEAVGSTGSFRPLTRGFIPIKKLLKSHQDLHHEVFSRAADLRTPSGTGIPQPAFEVVDSSHTRTHLIHSGSRPLSSRLGLPSSPSPSRGLPPPPMSSSRLSSAFESIPTLIFEGGVSPSSRVSSSQISSVKRFPPSRLPFQETAEQQPSFPVGSTLARSFSAAIPEPVIRLDGLDRSHSMSTITRPTRPTSRRRDSIVLQRVKAYNASQEGTTLSMETLSQFPTPPLPALPTATRTPKALDRSKYPFA